MARMVGYETSKEKKKRKGKEGKEKIGEEKKALFTSVVNDTVVPITLGFGREGPRFETVHVLVN